MVAAAPPCAEVMERFAEFVGEYPLIAHNASFDRKFLESEFALIGRSVENMIACSMLTARRIYPDAPNHQLGTLVRFCGIDTDGIFHRALADAQMTGHLWIAMINRIREGYGIPQVSFELMCTVSKLPRAKVPGYLVKIAGDQRDGNTASKNEESLNYE